MWNEGRRHRGFPAGPAAETPNSQCGGPRSNPWSGNWIPQATTQRSHMPQLKNGAAKKTNKISFKRKDRRGGRRKKAVEGERIRVFQIFKSRILQKQILGHPVRAQKKRASY